MGYRLLNFDKGVGQVPAPMAPSPPQQRPGRFRLIATPQSQLNRTEQRNEAGKSDAADLNTGLDVALSAGAGYLEGVAGLAGLPGDVRELGRAGLEYMDRKTGTDVGARTIKALGTGVDKLESAPFVGPLLKAGRYAPTGQQVLSGIEALTGPLPRSETTAGEYARTLGAFAPAAVLGPGGVARKAAMATIPALASETAGQVTKGTAAEPYARVAGALLGGVTAAGRKGGLLKNAVKDAPKAEAVKAQTDAAYDALRAAGIKYDANAYEKFLQSLSDELKRKGFRKAQAAKSADVIDYMIEYIGKSPTFDDLDSIRRTAGKAAQAIDPTDKGLASLLIERIDDFARRAPMSTNNSIPAGKVPGAIKEARETASRVIKNRQLEEMIEAAHGYQSGFESGLRNQFSNLLRNKKRLRGFSSMERAAIADVAHGRRVLSSLGRLGFDFSKEGNRAISLPTLGGGLAGYAAGDPFVAGATIAGASAAKVASRKLTDAAARRAQGVVLLGKAKQADIAAGRHSELVKRRIRQGLAVEAGRRPLEVTVTGADVTAREKAERRIPNY